MNPIHFISALLLPLAITCPASGATPQENTDWSLIGLTPEQQHFSPLHQVNDRNVSQLGLAWAVDLPTKDGPTGVPLIADGVVYESGALGKVFANNVRSGKLLWTFDAQVRFPMDLVPSWGARLTRGLALWDDKVITATGDCRLIAIDRKTGAKVWEAQSCDIKQAKTITGAPRVGGGKVFIGNSNADTGIGRGYVDAFDAANGKHLWRFFTIPGDPAKGFENKAMERAAKTWGKDYWKTTGGGSAWDALTYDPKLNLLYFGVDGPSPFNPQMRGAGRGDELFTNSIVAVNADTGDYVWHYQTTPNDGWNYGATMHIMLAELPVAGKTRRVVMTAPKNGFFYVLDAKTGKFLSAKHYVPVSWTSGIDGKSGRPIFRKEAQYWLDKREDASIIVTPSPMGAHNWMPMSFSPKTGLVYIPFMEMSALVRKNPKNMIGYVDVDFFYSKNAPGGVFKGGIVAWDPIRQKERWRQDTGMPYNGGLLATAGNLVFQGTTNGEFAAFQADSGRKLWSMSVGAGILAAPSTVMVDGEQFLIVPTGSGTTAAVGFAPALSGNAGKAGGPARLLAFKLNGQARLPGPMEQEESFPKPPLPRADAALIRHGREVWDANGCELCHGFQVAGGLGSVPDLRRSSQSTHDLFAGIVLGGLRADKGMPMFGGSITMDDLNALQAYVIDEAWKTYEQQQARPPSRSDARPGH